MKVYRVFMVLKEGPSWDIKLVPHYHTFFDKYSAIESAANLKAHEEYDDYDIYLCSSENGYHWTKLQEEIFPQFGYTVVK